MKAHLILKDFHGSQTGHDFNAFKAGETAPLSASLAAIAVSEGWAKPVEEAAKEIAKAPKELADAVLDVVEEAHAEDRETKVEAPTETKVEEPKSKKKGK